MIIFIIGIIVALVLFAALGIDTAEEKWRIRPRQVIAAAVFAVALVISMVSFVPTGYTGILTSFGKVEDRTVQAGINFIAPWQKVVKMDNRTQKQSIETSTFSSDIQQVDVVVTLNYKIDQNTAQTLYATVGTEYYDTILYPRALESIKTVFAGYSAEALVTNRSILGEEVAALISNDTASYGIEITGVSIENLDFTDAFTDAVEAKQVATQNKLTAETEQAQLTMEAEAEAARQVIAAEAEAEILQIQAEAAKYAGEKEAEMNKKLAESLTPELVEYYYANQWNGVLPEYYGGEGTIPVLNFGSGD